MRVTGKWNDFSCSVSLATVIEYRGSLMERRDRGGEPSPRFPFWMAGEHLRVFVYWVFACLRVCVFVCLRVPTPPFGWLASVCV